MCAATVVAAALPAGAGAFPGDAPTITSPAPGAITGSSVQITFTGEGQSYSCGVDGVETPCSSPHTFQGVSIGPHKLNVVGLFPWRGAHSTVDIEVKAPTAIVSGGKTEDDFVNSLSKLWSVTTDLPAVAFECQLGGPGVTGSPFDCVPPIEQPLPIEGIYTMMIRAIDEASNKGPWASHVVVADRTAPTIELVSGPADGSVLTDTTPEFIFRSNEVVSYACSLNEAPYIPCNIPHPIGPLPYGEHLLKVVAVDKASNQSSPVARRFIVVEKLPVQARVHPDSDILAPTKNTARSSKRVKVIKGRSRGARITRVDIGVLRIGWIRTKSGNWRVRCAWMTSKGSFKRGSCSHKKFHRAKGTTKFSYRLKRRLPRASYKFYSRARNAAGQIERSFSRRDRNRLPIRILRP